MRTYDIANSGDDATLRALLRDNAMPSWVAMSVEREPSYFEGAGRYGRDWAVIAREGSTPLGMYACSEQNVHLNGVPVELGYLGSLRVSQSHRHKLRILREGFASVGKFSKALAPALWYTAIATENHRARRLLEANLPGMPRYQYTNEMVTLALSRARGTPKGYWRAMREDEHEKVSDFYNRHASRYQFSPALSAEIVRNCGADFFVAERQGQVCACMAMWNQNSYKQVVARGYRQPLAALLPIYNAYARISRRIQLPKVGRTFDHTCFAFLAVAPALEQEIVGLLRNALALCPTAAMTFGLHSGHRWLIPLHRAFRPLTYTTRVYAVSFEGGIELDARPAQPEVAVL